MQYAVELYYDNETEKKLLDLTQKVADKKISTKFLEWKTRPHLICGSMKYEKEMQKIAFELETKHGYNALQCIYGLNKDKLTSIEMNVLKEAQFKRIEIADTIYVVDILGYIGDSTNEEISYVKEQGKEVIMHSSYDL